MRINGYVPSESIFNTQLNEKTNSTNKVNGTSFAQTLKDSLDKINAQQITAGEATNGFITVESDMDISEVMLLSEEAKMSLQYAVQVRNKLVDAFEEITKMQL